MENYVVFIYTLMQISNTDMFCTFYSFTTSFLYTYVTRPTENRVMTPLQKLIDQLTMIHVGIKIEISM